MIVGGEEVEVEEECVTHVGCRRIFQILSLTNRIFSRRSHQVEHILDVFIQEWRMFKII